MRPLLFKTLRYHIATLLVILPALAMAQPFAPEPCPSQTLPAPPTPVVQQTLPPVPPIPPAPPMQPHQSNCQEAEAYTFSSEKRKTFDKTYKVGKTDVLNIDNKFGSVHVNTWNRSEIQVKVDIISRANSDQQAQEMLNKISVADSRSGNTISVKTEMGSMNSKSGHQSFEINYTINMPSENNLVVKNSFGNVYLPDMKGKVDLNVRYGAFKAGNLANANNNIKASFCNSSSNTIGFLNKGNVELAYSTLNLGNTNGVNGSSKFSDFKIGNLTEALQMDVKYGTFRVDNVKKNFKSINVNGGFTPIQLHFENDTAFDFDVNVQFADFKVDRELVKFTTLEKGHTSAEYKGKFGSAAPKGSISITSKYNDVKFTK
ncbi:hypothetical protein [Pontibacter indicus]|uniref:Adhesin domain-containing protein n=1 Tax=Pontibacter indicus TaxID=1317125 RepID=A0A1R3XJR4_9BACT|nr:hypothetical protein [Pontibacter indicus]SIT91231.1 hypothetical protein SAMN05444128_2528 [Pontibacter indicus]